jgi:hypothetical protein
MGFDRIKGQISRLDLEQLDILKRVVEAGSELGPAAALHYCAEIGLPAPTWVVEAASQTYCAHLNPKTPRKRGRSSGSIERYQQDMIDLMRWEQLVDCRYNQKKCQHDAELVRTDARDLPTRYRESYLKMADWAGRDWLRAYECASMMLRGTPAFGGPDAVKASYCRVERNNKDPVEKWRYFLFDPEFLETIGLKHPSRWGQSSKWVPLYDLTL